eukprot:GSChrysophyteH2.ASY1.ANO1.285.1 assembled CDS
MTGSALPLVCFFTTVGLSCVHQQFYKQARDNKRDEPKASRRFRNALVELRIFSNNDSSVASVERLLMNDLLLEQAVKEVSGTLLVHVSTTTTTSSKSSSSSSSSNNKVLEYVSCVYQRLWGEMILHDNLNLNCVVGGDVPQSGFQTISSIYTSKSDLQAVYTNCLNKEDFERSHNIGSSTNHSVEFPKVKPYPITRTGDGGVDSSVYYFDACNERIPTFEKVALGGTFDRIHNGHKKLLTLAAAVCTGAITIGITGDIMLLSKKNVDLISSFGERKSGVQQFMSLIKSDQVLDIVELSDPFGPTIMDASIEAIVVSSETIRGALKINAIRADKGMMPLILLVTRRSESATLSSTFLRDRL